MRNRFESLPAGALLAPPLALTAWAYARVLHGELQFDDVFAIVRSDVVKGGLAGLGAIDFSAIAARPLTVATFALNYAAGRLDPFGYHLVNVAIHLGVVVLLWMLAVELLRRAGVPGGERIAPVAAGLFGLHPLASQAVAYVAQRAESMAALFAVATILLLLAAERADGGRRRALLVAAGLATFALGLASKINAVVAPLIGWLAVAGFPSRAAEPAGAAARRRLPIFAPFALGVILATVAALAHVRGRADAGFSVPGIDPWHYLLTQARATLLYLRLLLWPAGQSVEHDLRVATGPDAVAVVVGLLYAAALGAGALLLFRPLVRWSPRARAAGSVAGFGVLWWFAALAPTSSVIPVLDVAVEHRAYLASFGLLLAATTCASAALGRLAAPWPGRVGAVLAICAWAALGTALHARNAVWESGLALWTDAAAKAPGKLRAQFNLAYSLFTRGDLGGAIPLYRRALELPDDPFIPRADIEDQLASALIQAGQSREATLVLLSALERAPSHPSLLNTTAIAMLELGRPEDALRLASAALEAQPSFGYAYSTVGNSLVALGRYEEALAAHQRAAAIDPDVVDRHLAVARVAAALGRRRVGCEALEEYRAANASGEEADALGARLACVRPSR